MSLIPSIGFILGLSFWTHPISVYFVLTAFVLLAARLKFSLKSYLRLFVCAVVGSFPVLLNQVGHRFETLRFLFSSSGAHPAPGMKVKTILNNIIFLLSGEKNFLNSVYFIMILLGMSAIIFLSFKEKFLSSSNSSFVI